MRKKKIPIPIPIYFSDLVIMQVKEWDKINEKHGFKLDNSFDAIAFKVQTKKGYIKYMVCFKSKPTASIISHECVHLVNQVFIDRMMTLDPHNDEPQAYLTGWFVDQIDNFFNKSKDGK